MGLIVDFDWSRLYYLLHLLQDDVSFFPLLNLLHDVLTLIHQIFQVLVFRLDSLCLLLSDSSAMLPLGLQSGNHVLHFLKLGGHVQIGLLGLTVDGVARTTWSLDHASRSFHF